MLVQSKWTHQEMLEKVAPKIAKTVFDREGCLFIDDLASEGIHVMIVQLYDNYTRDHVIGDNSFVGFGFVYLKDDLYCYAVNENEPGGYRYAQYTKTLTLEIDSPYPFNEFLYDLIKGENDLDYIWTVKNENNKETILQALCMKYPEKFTA